MAAAFKCDRCGRFFDKRSPLRTRYHVLRILKGNNFDTDLCDDCEKELDLFLNNAKTSSPKRVSVIVERSE
jgi:hypothetical protein